MSKLKRYAKLALGSVVLAPHVLIYSIMKHRGGGKIIYDLHRWKDIKGMNNRSDIISFIELLITYPELRSVFYWRINKLAKLFFFWMPGRTNLYLMTKPQNVEGGFYVGHGWGTVVNAKKIGRNFRVGQNVTIGSRNCKEPIIGDNVSVWAHAIVLGDIIIGNDSQVGAGAVVVKSLVNDSVVVPPKSVIIKQNGERTDTQL